MSIEQLQIIMIASVVAVSCALPGVFLILRGVALMSDAISHAILFGIVVMFFMVESLQSPLLMVAATLTGILTVTLTECVIHSGRLKKDAAIGLIFPIFFSLGVLLISMYAGNIHLDQDAVLLGELAFAPFNRWEVFGKDLGPVSFWVMGLILVVNISFIGFFYKELKLSTFDKGLATALGYSPVFLHYGLMSMVSVTAVGAFDAVGSILVVALMITPPATAYLLCERLSRMLMVSCIIAIASSILGYVLAYLLEASIAGSMATVTGLLFILSLCFSPKQGLFMNYMLKRIQKIDFATRMLTVQLLDHEGTPLEKEENTFTNLITHMDWKQPFAEKVTLFAIQNGYITRSKDTLTLTPLGRERARQTLTMT